MLRILTLALALPFIALPQGLLRDLRTFDRVLLVESKAETSASVSVGDVDGDGKLDIVLAKGRHWPLHNVILRGDGKGHFTASNIDGAPDRTYTAALADLDGDGDLDLVVGNDDPDRKLIYKNDGKGHFTVSGTFGDPSWSTRYVTVADLNHDGRPDLIAANRGGGPGKWTRSYVCLNDGKGGFPVCKPLATESATIIVAADLDGDGNVDLFVPHRDGGQNLIFWNDGRGVFDGAGAATGPAHSSIRAAAAGDIDGDGKLDLVFGDEQTGVYVALNNGKRSFADAVHIGGGGKSASPYAIAIADMDRNGTKDIVVGNAEAPGAVYFNQSQGKRLRFQPLQWNDGKGSVYGVAIADLDGDGWPDIAAARSDAPNGVWFSDGMIQTPVMPGRLKPKPVDK